MFTGPLFQLQALTENHRRARQPEEGGRLCQAQGAAPIAAAESLKDRQVLAITRLATGWILSRSGALIELLRAWRQKLTRTSGARAV